MDYLIRARLLSMLSNYQSLLYCKKNPWVLGSVTPNWQPTSWLHDLYLHGSPNSALLYELRLFWANASALRCISDIAAIETNFTVLVTTRRWAKIRTHNLPDNERMSYELGHGRVMSIKMVGWSIYYSIMAYKPINIRWIRTGSQPHLKIIYPFVSYPSSY